MHSQIEPSDPMRRAVSHLSTPITVSGLTEMQHIIFQHINRIDVNDSNEERERNIRWKRSASQIWREAYTYRGKDCTDLVTVFQALCRVFRLTTRLIRVHDGATFHSIAEVRLADGWYIYDVATANTVPEKGQIHQCGPYGRWTFIRRGRTAWELNLDQIDIRRRDVTPTPMPL